MERTAPGRQLRVVLIDDHEISRCACRALLRTEGVDVVADHPVGEAAMTAVEEHRPDAVVVDVNPEDGRGLSAAQALRRLRFAPAVVLTSSVPRASFHAGLDPFPFIAKAELGADAVLAVVRG